MNIRWSIQWLLAAQSVPDLFPEQSVSAGRQEDGEGGGEEGGREILKGEKEGKEVVKEGTG